MEENLKITPADFGGKNLELRTGEALTLREPQVIVIGGNINAVADFLDLRMQQANAFINVAKKDPENVTQEDLFTALTNEGRLQHLDVTRAIVVADVEGGTIELRVNPENYYGPIISGKLEKAKELEIFGVNTGRTYTREQLIKLLRFNTVMFFDKEEQIKLLDAFTKFSVTNFIEISKEDDLRGNASAAFKRTVRSNIPLTLSLYSPIYKGQPKECYVVEICIEPGTSSVSFYFESPQLKELEDNRREEIFASQLRACTGFTIIKK